MKLEELLLKIRAIVREELQMALSNQQITKTQPTVTTESKSSRVVKQLKTPSNTIQNKTVTYSKNPVINKILNETKIDSNFMSESMYDDMSDWPTMEYNKNAQMGISNTIHNTANVIPETDLNGRPVNLSNVEDHVLNALTKDYSQLMKAIDKRKGR